jgi:hypothetical protein
MNLASARLKMRRIQYQCKEIPQLGHQPDCDPDPTSRAATRRVTQSSHAGRSGRSQKLSLKKCATGAGWALLSVRAPIGGRDH